ncbi:hypothetical protein [Streptomyces tubercidicus]
MTEHDDIAPELERLRGTVEAGFARLDGRVRTAAHPLNTTTPPVRPDGAP